MDIILYIEINFNNGYHFGSNNQDGNGFKAFRVKTLLINKNPFGSLLPAAKPTGLVEANSSFFLLLLRYFKECQNSPDMYLVMTLTMK